MKIEQRTFRRKMLFIVLPVFLLLASIYGLTYGSVPLSLVDVWNALTNQGTDIQETIIKDLRLPRVIIGLLVGACLAVSGALLQGVMKNPLADPGIIGVTAGGGLAACVIMLIFPALSYLLPLAAFAGAFLTSLIIYFLAWDKGASPLKIILAGVAISALLSAVQSGIMNIYSDRVQSVLSWLSGGLSGRSWYHLEFMYPYALTGLALSFFAIKPVNLLLLGDDSAKLLGQRVELTRLIIILIASFLAGAAVSVAGLVGFVGLVVPHIIRILIGSDYRYLLPFSALGGASLVVFADTIARSWFDPIELPVGILLAAIGAPFFMILLKKRSLVG
ncbi:iron ABC transporter permease [Pradoshia eiseniae]|uniref:Iron ABC transporter permease n=1 Tax=Pradoshia eiseniae TaxID=2064768 RepID=A0A2S7N5D9_9BACI|nr:iron ABC transporter permease [Pradoshia eiseniae]PQD97247.1 iron ABC transporter permease [Pradoshia eiseniae]